MHERTMHLSMRARKHMFADARASQAYVYAYSPLTVYT
jgi:hypothetical protein